MVLITGGGFIGQAVRSQLGAEALVLGRSLRSGIDIVSDLSDSDSADELVRVLEDKQITSVVHTAAVTPWSNNPDYAQDIAMAKTLTMVCNKLHVPSLLFMSGWNVYDMSQSEAPYNEETPVQPTTNYGTSKLAVERYFEENLESTKLVNARVSSVYGPGQLSAGLIPNIVQSALQDGIITLNSSATRRDYIYIRDLTEAIQQLINSDLPASTILNIGSGDAVSVEECARLVKDIMHELRSTEITLVLPENPVESDLLNNQLDITKARSMNVLHAQTSLKDGLRKYIQWRLDQ